VSVLKAKEEVIPEPKEVARTALPSILQHEKASHDYVVAIDFGGTKIDVTTANLKGQFLQQQRIETMASKGARQALERATAMARKLIAITTEMTGGHCLAVGGVSPGIILPDRVLFAPNIPGWEQLALLDMLREDLDIPHVVVGNDVKAAALAESRWGSLKDADPSIFLNLGTGIGAALIINGRVFTGAHGAAGEIAYTLRGIPNEKGAAYGHAPLEEAIGGRAISERGSMLLNTYMSAADVFARPDDRVRILIDEILAELAVHVANIAIFIDPMRIAVGGGMMGSASIILPALTTRLQSAVPFPPEVVLAEFVHDGALRGAVALALETL
jgi:predicted NBD/HSP70 family sugar kinase